MGIDLCQHCGGPAYELAAALTGVAFVLFKTGLWLSRPVTPGSDRVGHWSGAVLLWTLAATAAYAAWISLG